MKRGIRMGMDRFLIGTLFVWRATHLLNAEDGPFEIVVRLRRLAGSGFWGQLLDCFYCLSVWVAAPLAFFLGKKMSERLLLWPALSAGAILLERATAPGQAVHGRGAQPAHYVEDREDEHVLWTEAG